MNIENTVPEITETDNIVNDNSAKDLKTSSKIMRIITLALQVTAILTYYLPSLITGGSVDIAWLVIGVVQTIFFSAVFFRDERTRTGVSIALMVVGTLGNFVMLLLVAFFALLGSPMGLNFAPAIIYALCSLLALIFALSFPRKYR